MAESLTAALGSGEEGKSRRAAYERAAKKEFGDVYGALNKWIKKHLDKAADFKGK